MNMVNNLRFIPIEKFTSPSDGLFDVCVNNWYIVTQNNEIVVYGKSSIQFNTDKRICEMMVNNVYVDKGFKVVQIPIMYFPIRSNDFDRDI